MNVGDVCVWLLTLRASTRMNFGAANLMGRKRSASLHHGWH